MTHLVRGLLVPAIVFILGVGTVAEASCPYSVTPMPPPLSVQVIPNKAQYLVDEPIAIDVVLTNTNCPTPTTCQNVIASRGFSEKPFHLLLVFTGPDGKTIVPVTAGHNPTPPPPRLFIGADGVPIQIDPVEVVGSGFTINLADATQVYSLKKAGFYQVKAVIPIRTYCPSPTLSGACSQNDGTTPDGVDFAFLDCFNFAGTLESTSKQISINADADGDGYSFPTAHPALSPHAVPDCDDSNAEVNPGATEIPNNGIDDDCNPSTPDVVGVPPGTIAVRADQHTVGSGTKPGSTKSPIVKLPVMVFDKAAGSCASNFGGSWQHYKSIWFSCPPAAKGVTDSDGRISLKVPPGNYLVIGEYDPDTGSASTPASFDGDELYPGVSAGAVASGATVQKYLQVIIKADGKTAAAKYRIQTGSELMIIEPEYVEWSSTQELYPFIFQAVGDWTIRTSIQPPAGFVADTSSLTVTVDNSLAVAQFTVTNVGSDWISTKVTFRITHKKKTLTVLSQVGIKLSIALARAKGLTVFGNPLSGR